MEDIDRIEFYKKLSECKSKQEIEDLIEIIEDDELQIAMSNKLEQILEFNRNEDVKSIIRILEYAYLKFQNSHSKEDERQ